MYIYNIPFNCLESYNKNMNNKIICILMYITTYIFTHTLIMNVPVVPIVLAISTRS